MRASDGSRSEEVRELRVWVESYQPKHGTLFLTQPVCQASVISMTLHFNNPQLQAKVDQWVNSTGRPAEELVEDAIVGYFDELAQVRHTLDTRYDEIKSGKVKMIPGDVAYARLMDSIEARRPKA
jgi:hypothetical protein